MIAFPSVFGRVLIAVMFFVIGASFLFFGLTMFPPLIFISMFSFLFAPTYFWRAGRLCAEIQNGTLVVRSYFQRNDRFVPLVNLQRIYRGASGEDTVLEFPDRQFILSDSYFPDSKTRDTVFRSLQSYVKKDAD